MPVVLTRHASWPEVLWNFSRFKAEKRLTLKQSPHFYELLPTSRRNTVTFQHQKISVLIDNPGPGRVFLETAKETRVFRNAWIPKDSFIFKDIHGRLEGESIVGAAFQDKPNLWCYKEREPLSLFRAPQLALSPDRSGPSSNMTETLASVSTMLQGDWKEPIRQILGPLDLRPASHCVPSPNPPVGSSSLSQLNDGPNSADFRPPTH
ncbi:hypothetical protein BJV77DRAFT_984927 [Russula vinacea]|nr:hypothetical protein BJV77DRAFT_984927 [Russula vinacea]